MAGICSLIEALWRGRDASTIALDLWKAQMLLSSRIVPFITAELLSYAIDPLHAIIPCTAIFTHSFSRTTQKYLRFMSATVIYLHSLLDAQWVIALFHWIDLNLNSLCILKSSFSFLAQRTRTSVNFIRRYIEKIIRYLFVYYPQQFSSKWWVRINIHLFKEKY